MLLWFLIPPPERGRSVREADRVGVIRWRATPTRRAARATLSLSGGGISAVPLRVLESAFLAVLALPVITALAATVAAADYPDRAITLVVPYAAGGGNDTMARTVAEKMGRTLGQQVVVENRGGAGGTIATRQVAKSAPDGYTLAIGGTGALAIAPPPYPTAASHPPQH